MSGVRRLERISLIVDDLATARDFYADALGFNVVAHDPRDDADATALMGIEGVGAESLRLRLGREEIELFACTPRGRSYPTPRSATDPWFQHFAIVVADMPAAYKTLAASAMSSISTGGPQRLPASTGGITAFKFRDPEGHPLELSYFPPAVAAPQWREPAVGAQFLGIDHSAVAVADVARSVDFYTDVLGFRVGERLLNQGPTQARLDGLDAPVVDIVILHPADPTSPHLELLGYRTPTPQPAQAWRPNDAVATRLVLAIDGLDAILAKTPCEAIAAHGLVSLSDGARAVTIHDPDGHFLVLREPAPS